MKKIVNSKNHICLNLDDQSIYILVIENPHEMVKNLESLYEQLEMEEEESWILSENEKIIPLREHAVLVMDFFGVNPRGKYLISCLHKRLIKELPSSDLSQIWEELSTKMVQTMEKIAFYSDISIKYDEEPEFSSFLKIMNVEPAVNDADFLQRLISFIDLHIRLLGIDIFWLVNFRGFFSLEEW